jgi:hypothetical protein
MARARDGVHGFRSPVVLLELDRLAQPPLVRRPIRPRAHQLLNLSLFAALTATVFSGILISQRAIPALTGKAPPDMDWRWEGLHSGFTLAVVILSGFHLAINWEWVLAAGQKVFRRVAGKVSV